MMNLFLLACVLASASADPIVEGSLGRITGKILKVHDVEIESFLGIPFAKPPVAELRFALPQSFGAVGDLHATAYAPSCPQPEYAEPKDSSYRIDEDCLYLNVYRKRGTSDTEKKAVVAMIHGGGYVVGSSADPLMNAAALSGLGDVVLVSFNYRLGILGFADMKDWAPGNLGFYDQRLALQWIQDHVEEFGGDADQVTAIGVSAGSMSLSAQIITPIDSKNLFRSAVLDAGVVGTYRFHEDSDSSYARLKKIAEQIGCPVDSIEMVNCLRKASVDELLPLSVSTTGSNGFPFFVATTDGKFVPHDVENYIEKNSAKLRKVRTIVGYSRDEGVFFLSTSFLTEDFPNPKTRDEVIEYCKKLSWTYNNPLGSNEERSSKLIGEFYADKFPENSHRAVSAFQADGVFKCPINHFIRAYARHNDQVFAYQFERKLRSAYRNILNPDQLGVFHYSPYLHFTGILFLIGEPLDPADERFSLDAVNMMSSFVKSEKAPTFRGMEWPSYSTSGKMLIFDETPSLRKGLSSEVTCRELYAKDSEECDKQLKTER